MADDFDPYYQWLGIPPKHQPPNHYRLLAIEEFESNLDVIENAADQRVQHVRSFQNGPHGETSQRLLNEITAAKLCLLSLAKKAEYDQKLRAEKDAAEPRRLQPLPRIMPTVGPSEQHEVAPDAPSSEIGAPSPALVSGRTLRRSRRVSRQHAAIVGAALGALSLAAIFYVGFSDSDQDRTVRGKPGKSASSIDTQPASPAKVESRTKTDNGASREGASQRETEKTSEPVSPTPKQPPKIEPPTPGVVYLDDLQEAEFNVAGNTALGKHGQRGVGNLEAVLKGQRYAHAVGTHPGTGVPAHVVYDLRGQFAKFQTVAALLDVEGETETRSPVTFKVLGDSKLLWQSTPVQRLGAAQPLEIEIDEVKTLRLEVHCQGDYGLAHAAWVDPRLTPATQQRAHKDYVWIEDDVPAGARRQGNTPWEWAGKPYPVFSGDKSMRRSAEAVSQHFIDSVPAGLVVGEGDRFFSYVFLDPASAPKNLTLQFYSKPDWEHRAFWGDDIITSWGQPNSPSRRPMGALPKPGQWVRLEVPAERVGLKPGDVVTGMAFAQHGGTVYWDRAGLATRTRQATPSAAKALNGQLDTPVNPPPAPRVSRWVVEGGVQFKFSETDQGVLLELVPGTSKLYSKIQIPLTKSGQSWAGTGALYFRSSPEHKYDARIEILSGDIFGGKTMQVRTICPDANMRTKTADDKATWTRKD